MGDAINVDLVNLSLPTLATRSIAAPRRSEQ